MKIEHVAIWAEDIDIYPSHFKILVSARINWLLDKAAI